MAKESMNALKARALQEGVHSDWVEWYGAFPGSGEVDLRHCIRAVKRSKKNEFAQPMPDFMRRATEEELDKMKEPK